MKRFLIVVAMVAVLLSCSIASAGWRHRVAVVPVEVHSFYPVGPVYAYPAPAVLVPVPLTPVYVAPHAWIYPHRIIVRQRIYGRHVW